MRDAEEHSSGSSQLEVSVPLKDRQWLTLATAIPDGGGSFSLRFFISMAMMGAILVPVSIWAVHRVTAPLTDLSKAALRLGDDLNAPPTPEVGPIETRQAAHAFNAMQTRLRAMVDERTKTLAAISHDFRTPLTLLRLRVENIDDPVERDRMLSTIADLDAMVSAALDFAGNGLRKAVRRPTDLTALIASIVDDLADGGLAVDMTEYRSVIYRCDPSTFKRALTNLIDNAVKYGGSAHVAICEAKDSIEITVDDEGPGISAEKLSHVFEPLYRLEQSRNRDTGGIGLGLAIALSIVKAHGGSLVLNNRSPTGLRATISLPHNQ